jgi:hypothetical protein
MITPKNWEKFQHYKHRKPPWIRLHRALLDKYEFVRLPVASKALAPCIWLLASEYDKGRIPLSLDAVAFRVRMSREDFITALKPLIDADFFETDEIAASAMLAAHKQSSSTETETESETEKKKRIPSKKIENENDDDWPPNYFEVFWQGYPKKVGKIGAAKALRAVRKRKIVTFAKLIAAVQAYAATSDPNFTKNPQTWINDGCWDDEPDGRKPNGRPDNLVDAADRLAKQGVSFGPRPGSARDEPHEAPVRMLPKNRSE